MHEVNGSPASQEGITHQPNSESLLQTAMQTPCCVDTVQRSQMRMIAMHEDSSSPASQKGVAHQHNVGRLLADSCAKAVILSIPEQHQLRQAECKDGAAQDAAGEDEGQEESVISLHEHAHISQSLRCNKTKCCKQERTLTQKEGLRCKDMHAVRACSDTVKVQCIHHPSCSVMHCHVRHLVLQRMAVMQAMLLTGLTITLYIHFPSDSTTRAVAAQQKLSCYAQDITGNAQDSTVNAQDITGNGPRHHR